MSAIKRAEQWHYRKWVRLPDGKRTRIFGTPPINTKAAALVAERAAIERLTNPQPEPVITRAPITVAEYVKAWVSRRRELDISADDVEARLRLHAMDALGSMRMDEVKPRHLRDLVLELRAGGKLAARTIRQVSGVLHTLFKSAVIEEVIPSNPVMYEVGVLPRKADKDPDWRHQAVFTRDEVEALLSDDRIPADRRMFYGFKMLAAMRHGEAAALAWRQIDTTIKPLGRINLGKTKSGVPRAIPIHPTLAKMLATWKLAGWFNTYGRQPKADDLVVPTFTMNSRVSQDAQDALVSDLKLLGYRVRAGARMNRRGHDLRRTFISLALADGAHRDRLEWVTHGPRGDIMSMYTSLPWEALCGEVCKLRISLHEGALVSLRHETPSALTLRGRRRWQNDAQPARLAAGAPGGHQKTELTVPTAPPTAVALETFVTPSRLEGVTGTSTICEEESRSDDAVPPRIGAHR